MAKSTLNLRIDERLKKDFQKKLDETHETATDVITRAIEAYCNDSNASNDDNCNDTANSNDDNCNSSNASNDDDSTTKKDTSQLEARIEALEQLLANFYSPIDGNRQQKKITETQQRLTKLEDNFGDYVDTRTKQLKQDLKQLKHDYDWFKPKVVERSEFVTLEEKLDQKVDRATFNGWAEPYPLEIDPQPTSNQKEDRTPIKVEQDSLEAKLAKATSEEEKIEILANDEKLQSVVANGSKISPKRLDSVLTELLTVRTKLKPDNYKATEALARAFKKESFTKEPFRGTEKQMIDASKGLSEKKDKAKHYLAYQVLSLAVEIARDKAEINT